MDKLFDLLRAAICDEKAQEMLPMSSMEYQELDARIDELYIQMQEFVLTKEELVVLIRLVENNSVGEEGLLGKLQNLLRHS